MDEFLAEVEAYLARTGLTATDFGVQVLNDANFVHQLRRGRSPRLSTVEKVRRFIAEGPPLGATAEPAADSLADPPPATGAQLFAPPSAIAPRAPARDLAAMSSASAVSATRRALLVLADGTVIPGLGAGAATACDGELCFTTGMTGYQETMTDPSFAAQIVTFTQPELGVVGCNEADQEAPAPAATGLVARHLSPVPSNYRATQSLEDWLTAHSVPAIHGVDTRTLTRHLRDKGAQMARLISLAPGQRLSEAEIARHQAEVAALPGMAGRELAAQVSLTEPRAWTATRWRHGQGYGAQANPQRHVVAIDYGAKHMILRCLAEVGCQVTVMPATSTVEEILALDPGGLFLSNGPGDPAATANYAVPVLRRLLEHDLPVFGICIGHQLLAEALGAKTRKMARGHRGANQPVQDLSTGRVHVTSQNHGFEVITESLPDGVVATETSLFDGSNEGLRVTGRPVFSVQYHPEASPGPHDTLGHFRRFAEMIDRR